MERLYITKENFSYLTAILNYANFIYALMQESTQDPNIVVNSVLEDPFNNNETYLQHNQVVVNQVFKLIMTFYLRTIQVSPDNHLTWLIKNIYLKVLASEHDFHVTQADLEFCSAFADYLFKYRTRLVNIGEQEVVGDLFSNIYARIHITLELIKMIEGMKKDEAPQLKLAEREPAEL